MFVFILSKQKTFKETQVQQLGKVLKKDNGIFHLGGGWEIKESFFPLRILTTRKDLKMHLNTKYFLTTPTKNCPLRGLGGDHSLKIPLTF